MNLTWRHLQEMIAQMNEEQLDTTVAVYDANNDEVHGMQDYDIVGLEEDDEVGPGDDVLDPGHPYLIYGI
jgi:hypothetical protein